MKISERFGIRTVRYQTGWSEWHYRLIGRNAYLFGYHWDNYGKPSHISREVVR